MLSEISQMFYLYEVPRLVKYTVTESRTIVASGWGASPWGTMGLDSVLSTHPLKICTSETTPETPSFWKAMGLPPMRPIQLLCTAKWLLESSRALTCPRNQCTSGWLRDAQTLHEKGLSAYLRASAWGAGTSFNTHLGVFWGKRLLGAIFTCSLLLFRVPISSKRKLLHTSCALVFMSSATVFMAVGWRACIPGSHGTVTIKDIVLGQLPCSGHSRDSRVKYNPSLSVKDAFCFFWSFGVRCRHLVWHTSSSQLRLFQEEKAGGSHLWTLLLPGFSLPVSPRKKLVYISPAPCFLWLSPRNTYRSLGCGGQHDLCLWSPKVYVSA